MQGKVLGVPLVLIVLALVILVPVAVIANSLSSQIANVQAVCSQRVSSVPTVMPSDTPTATPSATSLKRTVVPATTSGKLK